MRGPEHLLQLLLAGGSEGPYLFTPGLVGALCDTCEMVRGKRPNPSPEPYPEPGILALHAGP